MARYIERKTFIEDNQSRLQIYGQLRQMNDGQIERLQDDNVFNIVMADTPNRVVMNQFIEHLDNDSVRVRNEQLDNLASFFNERP